MQRDGSSAVLSQLRKQMNMKHRRFRQRSVDSSCGYNFILHNIHLLQFKFGDDSFEYCKSYW